MRTVLDKKNIVSKLKIDKTDYQDIIVKQKESLNFGPFTFEDQTRDHNFDMMNEKSVEKSTKNFRTLESSDA